VLCKVEHKLARTRVGTEQLVLNRSLDCV
jgi:hypothetical protein